MTQPEQKVLIVAICGFPNAGKSSIVNSLMKAKLSAVSSKAQTTRDAVSGILTKGDTQVVITDTPGLFRASNRGLDKKIVKNAKIGLLQSDLTCFVLDPQRPFTEKTKSKILEYSSTNENLIVAINKIDALKDQSKVLELAKKVFDVGVVKEIFFISAKTKVGLDKLKNYFFLHAKEGFWHYEKEKTFNKSIDFRLNEITREKLFKNLHHEVPYGLNIEMEKITEDEDTVDIRQIIFVQKRSQKAIVIGKGGQLMKKIAGFATIDMEKFLGKRVRLYLFVKVKEDINEEK